MTHAESSLVLKNIEELKSDSEKEAYLKSHRVGRPINMISFQSKSNIHRFTSRFVLPDHLSDLDLETALSQLPMIYEKAEKFLTKKEKLFKELEGIKFDDHGKYHEEITKNGFMVWDLTVFYFSAENNIWINAEEHGYKDQK